MNDFFSLAFHNVPLHEYIHRIGYTVRKIIIQVKQKLFIKNETRLK